MTSPVELVRLIYADVARGDLPGVVARLSEDFIAEQNATLAFAGRWSGPEGFAAMGAEILRAFPGFSVSPERFHETGAAVLVEARVRAPAQDGRPALDQLLFEYWEFEGGRAVACRPFYTDLAAATASSVFNGEP
jgi:ketosteroid isomerase-like protein